MSGGSNGKPRKRRREADIVRFEVTQLPSGLFRHRPVKFVMLMNGEQAGVRWPDGMGGGRQGR